MLIQSYFRFLFLLFLGLNTTQTLKAQTASKSLTQVIEIVEEMPNSLHIKCSSSPTIKKINGSKIKITGKVKLSDSNASFLDHLEAKGRYALVLTPAPNGRMNLTEKNKTPIVIRGKNCKEEIQFTIHVPKDIKSVVFENTTTGISNIIVMQ